MSSLEITRDRVERFLSLVKAGLEGRCKVMIITTELQTISHGSPEFYQKLIDDMKEHGIWVITKEDMPEYFAAIGYELVWHGGINFLGKEDTGGKFDEDSNQPRWQKNCWKLC